MNSWWWWREKKKKALPLLFFVFIASVSEDGDGEDNTIGEGGDGADDGENSLPPESKKK